MENIKINSNSFEEKPKNIHKRIDEVHSMIMESAGEYNLSKIAPNWKNMSMDQLMNYFNSFAVKKLKVSESEEKKDLKNYTQFLKEDTNIAWNPVNYSPKFMRSKFAKMSPDEITTYARESPEKRKEVRDIMEREYNWMIKNAPESIFKRMETRRYNKLKQLGKDPHDEFGDIQGAKSPAAIFIALLPFIIQLIIWIAFN